MSHKSSGRDTAWNVVIQLTCGPSYGIRVILPSTKSSRWLIHITLLIFRYVIIITRVSEVMMFSPCVFVCLWLCLCLYHDVCPDDLTMKDWCHTNNILQVHCWGCLVVQVRFHALMTSSMTSPCHKVGQSDIFSSIFELERRSKAQNVENAHGYLSGVFNFRYNFQ